MRTYQQALLRLFQYENLIEYKLLRFCRSRAHGEILRHAHAGFGGTLNCASFFNCASARGSFAHDLNCARLNCANYYLIMYAKIQCVLSDLAGFGDLARFRYDFCTKVRRILGIEILGKCPEKTGLSPANPVPPPRRVSWIFLLTVP